ncbi:peptidoglycan-binding protein [Caproiciproducens galactitolivorans]|uniref:Peptidoglycan-binding protein n=1 Tax=Caproiciproducens galactitolivorans TaxID=642589 RepID=A0ABT4BRV6_9FIRM|nr:peptidoglycan-binding protein [Caproiciproducens galactitolivorans]MCY1713630.1 peptidoglycan-binding protein [Caproiciproducens galactitolivorans]
MLKKLTALFLSAILAAGMLMACGPKNDISSGAGEKDFPVKIGEVTINQEPSGVAVLSPNLADVILTMDYEVSLKAKSADCTQSDLAVLPNVTMDEAQKIKDLGANLVLTDTKPPEAQMEAFNKAGITVLTIAKATGREDLDRLYSQVGSALKGAKTGYEHSKKASQSIFLTIDDISRIIPKSNKPITVAYLYDTDGGVVTGDTLQGKLIEAAGLINAASDGTGNKMPVNELLIANPQYIFCPTGVKAKLAESPEYKKLDAVKSGKVYEMDPKLMLLQGRGMVDAVTFIAGKVYPQLLEGTNASGTSSTGSASPGTGASGTFDTSITLKKGDKNDNVLKMQNRLQELGYMFVKPSGEFAEGTEQSVKDFQFLNGLPATGVAEPKTLQKLFSDNVKKRTTP